MAKEISNSEDMIDSRHIIRRIADLESDLEAAQEDDEARKDAPLAEWAGLVGEEPDNLMYEEAREYLALKAMEEEAENCADWHHGATLIRDSYFKRYAQELADDIGAIDNNASWPLNCIDWDQAADELKADYTDVDFDGVDYWVGG